MTMLAGQQAQRAFVQPNLRSYRGRGNDDLTSPYADLSGAQDTGFYPEDQPYGGDPFMQDWRNRIFRDNSWLPNAPGRMMIVPAELVQTPGNTAGYRLPAGYGISPNPTPPFTPPGRQPVPSVGIVVIPRPSTNAGPMQRQEGWNVPPRLPHTL